MAERRKDNKKRVLKEGEHQRPNGTYEYKWRNKAGIRRSVYAKTLEELREKELDILRDVLDGIDRPVSNITINDLYSTWKQVKRGLKDNTFQNYKYMYEMFVFPEFGKTKISSLKKTDVRAFYNSLAEVRNLKVDTIDSVHTVLHQVLNLAVEDNYIRVNPSDAALKELRMSRTEDKDRKKALTRAEQKLFEDYLTRPDMASWYPIFTVMLWTGMRVGEATGLTWDDIDYDRNVIKVNHTLVYYQHGDKKAYYGINTTKTRAGERTIPMLPIVKTALEKERRNHQEFDIQCSQSIDGYTDFVFLNRFGLVHNFNSLNRALKRIIKSCNFYVLDHNNTKNKETVLLPSFSNHSLRHTFTTRMCEAGVNIKVMQDILGHADAQTTLNIYTDVTKEMKDTEMHDFDVFMAKQ